ncbi:MAG TPA: cytochrome c oxidase subunit II [Beijerinckiaceae bacterium]|nr:cytochrome c oxidase subunit II [Beijerinckiaceae bacterium]HVB89502.1 cytochrome c oxidase subunit II [Beijerinckiaceae bacterium]
MSDPVFLPEASTIAPRTDAIFFVLLGVSGLIVVLVAGLLALFCWKYRRDRPAPRGPVPAVVSREFEIGWTLATLFAFLLIFLWAAAQNFASLGASPANATDIHVVAKQWMWKVQHPGGQRELNALHLPVNRPVRLIMNSEDVIHSFFVPAFRVKRDVVPGHTEILSFEPTLVGKFQLFCGEFCGTNHSAMIGQIIVMKSGDYARWLAAQPQGDDLAGRGAALFRELGCSGCHGANSSVHAPKLAGIFGKPVPLADGRIAQVNDAFIRDMILKPRKHIVAGFDPIMPSFAGRVDEGDLVALVAYLRSLSTGASL